MSFCVSDLIAMEVIEEGLQRLRNNPDHLNFLLSRYHSTEFLRKKLGSKYINQCAEWVRDNKILVRPYEYSSDTDRVPNLVITFSNNEDQTFLGDQSTPNEEIIGAEYSAQPQKIATFDVVAIGEDIIDIPEESRIYDKVWTGLTVVSGTFSAIIKQMIVVEGKDTQFVLDKIVPAGTAMKGWTAQTLACDKLFNLNASAEKVRIQAKLSTSGDIELHKMVSIIIRYCLKSGRLSFENNGLHNATMSQSAPLLTNTEDKIFESLFTIVGTMQDFWIVGEIVPTGSGRVVVDIEAKNSQVEEGAVALDEYEV